MEALLREVENMRIKTYTYYACDFETTVYKGQEDTQVWSACMCKFNTEDVVIFGSIDEWLEHCLNLLGNTCLYFHNLKFDGSFIIDHLLRNNYKFNRVKDSELKSKEFKCSISEMGQWYTITVKSGRKLIEIRDSLKLLPFSLERIGNSFGTKHKKLKMEYKGYRYPNCPITKEEEDYIKNDVLVLKEALEIMFKQGHNELTIGSCCLKEFKKSYDKIDYDNFFPDLTKLECPVDSYENCDEYIRKSYRGGWCYLQSQYANKIIKGGKTYDVNSLYPSEMHSISGNRYPIGKPMFFKGNDFDNIKDRNNILYFIRFECYFKLRPGYLPTVQIKTNFLYKGNEYLSSSDVFLNGKYHRFYIDTEGNKKEATVTLTMTKHDYETFIKHYEIEKFKPLDGCYFRTELGIFDEYIDKYALIKKTTTGAERELAKLYLNNLYGKEAASTDSSYKVPYLNENNIVSFDLVNENEKKAGYIPIGSYITSYARNFTIRAAQKNYDNFIYADTDSIHLKDGTVKGIRIHSKNFCCWKCESHWDKAIFVRQKTYIERIIKEEIACKPYMNVKCAGMPNASKEEFLSKYRMEDFHVGLRVGGKLRPKRIKGGILLVETNYEMR